MALSAFHSVLVAQLLVCIAADMMDGCIEVAGRNQTMCNELSANCTWSAEKKVCHFAHSGPLSGRAEDRLGGKRHKESDRMDGCMKTAGHNETMCKELSANCTWSAERKMCYFPHSRHEEHRRGGEGHKKSNKMDGCMKTAGRNETICKELSANCTWSAEENVCYFAHSGRAEHRADDKRHKHTDRMDGCMKIAGRNETMCQKLSAICTWSAEQKVCHFAHSGRAQDRLGGKGHKDSGRMDGCMKSAGRNETMCKKLSAKCTWSAEKKVCHFAHSGHAEDRFGGEGHKDSDRMDGCMNTAGRNETMCKELSAKCTWSAEKKVCYFTPLGLEDYTTFGGKGSAKVGDRRGGKGNKDSATFASSGAVDFTLRLNNIQFSLLSANPPLLSEFKLKLKSIIAAKAIGKVSLEHVSLEVKPGSVIVVATVSPPSGISVDEVQVNLATNLQDLDEMTYEVEQVLGIQAVTSGAISTSLISAPVARNKPHSKESEMSEPKSFGFPFIVGATAGGAVMLACISFVCFKCKAPARKARMQKAAEVDGVVMGVMV